MNELLKINRFPNMEREPTGGCSSIATHSSHVITVPNYYAVTHLSLTVIHVLRSDLNGGQLHYVCDLHSLGAKQSIVVGSCQAHSHM